MENKFTNLRIAANLSRADLAKACGISRQAVRLIELGESVPTIKTARRLAANLKTTVEELWPMEEE